MRQAGLVLSEGGARMACRSALPPPPPPPGLALPCTALPCPALIFLAVPCAENRPGVCCSTCIFFFFAVNACSKKVVTLCNFLFAVMACKPYSLLLRKKNLHDVTIFFCIRVYCNNKLPILTIFSYSRLPQAKKIHDFTAKKIHNFYTRDTFFT